METESALSLVGSRYRLRHSLGAGGSGQVWEGEDTLLQRPVAVKAIDVPSHLEAREREVLRARVLREARAAARIEHPDSVRVFDVVDEPGRVYLIMELVEAPTLGEVVERDGLLRPEQAAAMGLEVLGALEAAHAAGIVHRDVKPRNVMVLPDGHVKLADFGIATVKDDPRITTTGMVLGTPSYMAPEQARGEVAGPATDLWGLGAMLYYAVEGVSPFERGEPLTTLNAVLHDEPRPMARAGSLAPVLAALLAKDPADRPAPGEARRLLAGVASTGDTTVTTPLPPRVATEPPAPELEAPPPARWAPAASGRPPGRLALGAAIILLVLLAGLALVRADRDDGGDGDQVASDSTTTSSAPATTAASQSAATTAASEAPTTTAASEAPITTAPADQGSTDTPAVEAPASVPADWVEYADPATGYSVSHPPGWTPRVVDRTRTDFVDPATGDYLRVDWVRPHGPDAVAGWEAAEPAFASRVGGYRRITIEPARFGELEAALWEYTYEGRHASNLAILAGDYGFALNFQTSEDRWRERQDVRAAFEAGFRPPA